MRMCFRCTEGQFIIDEKDDSTLIIGIEGIKGTFEYRPINILQVGVGPVKFLFQVAVIFWCCK